MSGLSLPSARDRAALEAVGFEGFVPFVQLRTSSVSTEPGIYIVLRTSTAAPELLAQTRARSGAPYSVADLQRRWVPQTPVLYIGEVAPAKGGLRKRLAQYARKGSSHAGGRSIWRLADQDDLLVAWVTTPESLPTMSRSLTAPRSPLCFSRTSDADAQLSSRGNGWSS